MQDILECFKLIRHINHPAVRIIELGKADIDITNNLRALPQLLLQRGLHALVIFINHIAHVAFHIGHGALEFMEICLDCIGCISLV